jgi:sulfide dehydrogenase cytochrome subunit
MKNKSFPAALAASILFTVGSPHAAGIRSADMLAHTCAGCHGTNGASAGVYMPTIGGLDRGYLTSVLSDYKHGLRKSTIMGRIMKGYSDQEIWAMSSWFAEKPWVSNDAVADSSLLALGREIHESKCETCHEDGGRIQDEENPRLAGQWVGYTHYMLEQCREIGKRCKPRKMGERMMNRSDEELRALAHYYASEK